MVIRNNHFACTVHCCQGFNVAYVGFLKDGHASRGKKSKPLTVEPH